MCARASVGQTARENSIWPWSRGGLWTQLHQFTARLTSLEPTPLSQLSVKLYLGKSFSRWQQNQHKSKVGTPDSRAGLDLAAWDTPRLAEGLWADCAPLSPCFLPCSASPICSDISLSLRMCCATLFAHNTSSSPMLRKVQTKSKSLPNKSEVGCIGITFMLLTFTAQKTK